MKCRVTRLTMRTLMIRALSYSAVTALTLNPALTPVIASEIPLAEFDKGLKRMADRAVIGKIIVHIP